jgi:hypothetical protein
MSAESVALIPECGECESRWLPADEDRWSAYLTDDEPDCAEREFGLGVSSMADKNAPLEGI